MFDYIKGLVSVYTERAVIEAGGIGYELFCSAKTLREMKNGQQAKLFVHFYMAQDVLALYGFISAEERAMFRRLISVTRIGPKVALSILSKMNGSDVALAIVTDNPAAFDSVPGIGRKTAARLILELKEKISNDELLPAAGVQAYPQQGSRKEAIEALVSLGYDGLSASRAVAEVDASLERTEDVLAQALKVIAAGR